MKVLYVGPSPHTPRGQCNLTLHAQGGVVKGRCPYCGAEVKVRVRPGQVREVIWLHEPWCPVPEGF